MAHRSLCKSSLNTYPLFSICINFIPLRNNHTIYSHLRQCIPSFYQLFIYQSLVDAFLHSPFCNLYSHPSSSQKHTTYSHIYQCISSLCQPFIYLSSLTLFYTRNSAFSRHVRSTSMIHISPLLKTPPTTHFAFTVLCAPRQSQHPIQLHCISLGDAYPLHMSLPAVTYPFNSSRTTRKNYNSTRG